MVRKLNPLSVGIVGLLIVSAGLGAFFGLPALVTQIVYQVSESCISCVTHNDGDLTLVQLLKTFRAPFNARQ